MTLPSAPSGFSGTVARALITDDSNRVGGTEGRGLFIFSDTVVYHIDKQTYLSGNSLIRTLCPKPSGSDLGRRRRRRLFPDTPRPCPWAGYFKPSGKKRVYRISAFCNAAIAWGGCGTVHTYRTVTLGAPVKPGFLTSGRDCPR